MDLATSWYSRVLNLFVTTLGKRITLLQPYSAPQARLCIHTDTSGSPLLCNSCIYVAAMRLLSSSDLRLNEFYDAKIPEYAILSHVWGDEEVSLQMLEKSESKKLDGYTKIRQCCNLALSQGWKYVWIDTCCIDKTSSADLSEAINSMYRWYENAQVCYVYMADVEANNEHLPFHSSRWFFRGWTLQELLAPWTVVFYDTNWNDIGTKWGLIDDITQITGITHHQMIDHKRVNIAVKMSWASLRRTTRVEDIAYSLMGLFNINMPLLYGEGSKAFMRLQHEILLTHEGDESIFAWTDTRSRRCGLLAWSPRAFQLSGDIRSVENPNLDSEPPSVSKRTLTMDGLDFRADTQIDDKFRYLSTSSSYIKLNCVRAGLDHNIVGIELTDQDQYHLAVSISGEMTQRNSALDYYVRSSPGTLMHCKSFRGSAEPDEPNTIRRTMKISLDHVSFSPFTKKQRFSAILPSPLDYGFAASEKWPDDAEIVKLPSFFPLKTRPEGWKVVLSLPPSHRSSLAALMFRNEINEAFAVILGAEKSGVSVDIVVPKGNEILADLMNKYAAYGPQRSFVDRSVRKLHSRHLVCATSRKRLMNYESVFFVEIVINPIDIEMADYQLEYQPNRVMAAEVPRGQVSAEPALLHT